MVVQAEWSMNTRRLRGFQRVGLGGELVVQGWLRRSGCRISENLTMHHTHLCARARLYR